MGVWCVVFTIWGALRLGKVTFYMHKQIKIALIYEDRPYSNPGFAPLEAAESTPV
jgi:hypothetical protein